MHRTAVSHRLAHAIAASGALFAVVIGGCTELIRGVPPVDPSPARSRAPASTPTLEPAAASETPTRLPAADAARGLFDVGGYRLYMECQGQRGPTVVLESGFSASSTVWAAILPKVAAFTRVCAYDRANRGKSDPGPLPSAPLQMVAELRALLRGAQIDGPYVLVGQSFGGLLVQVFASRYPAEVARLVLVDAVHEDYYADFNRYIPLAVPADGIVRGVDIPRSGLEARAAVALPDVPMLVLARGGPDSRFSAEGNQQWPAWQVELSKRSPRGRLMTIQNSSHDIHLDQPAAVIDAIRTVVGTRP